MHLHGIQMETRSLQIKWSGRFPQYFLPSHGRVSTLSLMQAAPPFPPPAEVMKEVPNIPAWMCRPHPAPPGALKKFLVPSAEFYEWAEERSLGKALTGSFLLSPRSGICSPQLPAEGNTWGANVSPRGTCSSQAGGSNAPLAICSGTDFWVTLRKVFNLPMFPFPKWKTEIAALPSFQQSKCIKDCKVMVVLEGPRWKRLISMHLLCTTPLALSFNLLLLSIIVT